VAWNTGDYAAASRYFAEELAICSRLGDTSGIAITHHNLGRLAAAEGSYARARSHYEQALALHRQSGNADGAAYALWVLGTNSLYDGDAATATAHFRESLSIFRELGDQQGEAYILHGLARVAQRTGDDLEALRLFRDVLTLRQSIGERNGVIECCEEIAAVVARRGHIEQATQLLGAAAALRAAISLASWVAEREAVEQTLALARRTLTGTAFAEAWETGQGWSLEQATAEALRLTEESTVISRPPAPFNLTKRELEVLALLCEHLTDAEIAERLFLSPRTASNHVANILSKLGAANRREAITLATRHGLV
jgi:DNA-binding CsgD family transcriptional regulator